MFGAHPEIARVLMEQTSEPSGTEEVLRAQVCQRRAIPGSKRSPAFAVFGCLITYLRESGADGGIHYVERIDTLPYKQAPLLLRSKRNVGCVGVRDRGVVRNNAQDSIRIRL